MKVEDLQDRFTALEQFYAQRNQNMTAWRLLYFLKKESVFFDEQGNFVPPRDDEIRVIVPAPFNQVEGFRSLLLTKQPTISVPTFTTKRADQAQADELERILYAAWYAGGVVPAVRMSLWHALTDGWGVVQWVYDGERENSDEFPFYAVALDPMGVYPMPAARPGQWSYVFVDGERTAGELRDMLADRRTAGRRALEVALDGLKDTDLVRVVDYWDREVNGFAVVNTAAVGRSVTSPGWTWIKKPTPHKFGDIPFAIYFGVALPFRDNGTRMGISVLYPMEEVIRYANRLLSQKATIIGRYADPTRVTKTAEGAGFEWPAGNHLALDRDDDAYFLENRGPTPQIDMMVQEIMDQVEDSGLPKHMLGRYVGKMSGVGLSLLRNPTLMKIAFKQSDLEDALRYFNTIILRSLENYVSKPIAVWGMRGDQMMEVVIDPKRIGGFYLSHVKLSTSLPSDEPAIVSMLATLVQLQILSRQTSRDVMQQSLGDIVPQSMLDEEDRVLVENFVLQNPTLFQAVAALAAKKAGVPIQEGMAALQALMNAQQSPRPQPRESLPVMGAESGLSPQTATNAVQTTRPDALELIQRMLMQQRGQQGGRPSESVESFMSAVAGGEE